MAVAGAAISLCALIVGLIWPAVSVKSEQLFASLNFTDTVFHGMLCFLLFAGAMHVDVRSLYRWRVTVTTLTTVGVLMSTLVVAFTSMLVSNLLGLDIPFPWLLVFGALISPTDPVSVLALLRELKAPQDLETKIAGESLLNDGTALVLFSVFLAMALDGEKASVAHIAVLFAQKVFGGLLLGAFLGWLGHHMLRLVKDAPTAVVMTLTYALGGYTLGEAIGVSGPLVSAVMGLLVGSGRHSSMNEGIQSKLIPTWEMFDQLLNMVLFLLVGLSLIALPMSVSYALFGVSAIVCALVARYISVSLPLTLVYKAKQIPLQVGTVQAMAWGGVRGGVSLAMVLSLPDFNHKQYLVWATWSVVMFSLLVQAPTMGKVLRHYRLIEPKLP
jgi:CPA1 family monovalent cation:H+ antiporter